MIVLFEQINEVKEMIKQGHLNVPMELIRYAHAHKMHKAMGIYLLMKASCDGHMVLPEAEKPTLMNSLGIRDRRSFSKYLQCLKDENWIGYDVENQIYYIRGFSALRQRYGLYTSPAVLFDVVKDAAHITAFVQGAIINYEVNRRGKARKAKIRQLVGGSALRKESAIQDLVAKGKISGHTGLSLSKISKLLGVSQSQADRIKERLKGLGYIKTKAKFNVVLVSDKPNFTLIKFLPTNRRYSVNKRISKKGVVYEFRERSYDEIFSCMEFSLQKSTTRRLRILANLEEGGSGGVSCS